jgi:transposase
MVRMNYIDSMARPISTMQITADEERELRRRVAGSTVSKRDHMRAEIVLLRIQGMRQVDVAQKLGVSVPMVNKWSQRFDRQGLDGLNDAPGRGRKESIPVEVINRVITEATSPPRPMKRWSSRTMAAHVGISADSVNKIWRANDIKPHIMKTFKVSNDPQFEEKFWDVIGLYLNPPEKALVFCCDEKSQCQALERTQLALPLGAGGYRKTKTHDYTRHGTITLFAALNYLDGKIIHRTEEKHTHVEWLRFLKQIDRDTPKGLDIHLIVDNYGTHKEENVRGWLAKHPRFKIHFTPTSSSWMNLIERFFADITSECIRDGSLHNVRELVKDIELYMVQRNLKPKRYVWKAGGEAILRKIERARAKISNVKMLDN